MSFTNWSTGDYLEGPGGILVGASADIEVLYTAWGYATAFPASQIVFMIGRNDAGAAGHRRVLYVAPTGQLVTASKQATSGVFPQATGAFTADAWDSMAASFIGNSTVEVWQAGANKTTNSAGTANTNAPNLSRIGLNQGGGDPWDNAGALAEIALWDVTGFSVSDRDSLVALAGIASPTAPNPLAINSQGAQPWSGRLIAYWLDGANSIADLSGNGHDMTMVGSLSAFASHPPVDPVPAASGGALLRRFYAA